MGWRAPEPPADLEGPSADPEQVARTIALRRLEAAPRTRAELTRTLSQRGVPDDVAERVLDRFEAVGLVDDAMFARMWVESRHSARGLSARALQSELRRKGVADGVVADAVSAVSADDELAAARSVALRKAPGLRGLPRPTQVRRLSGALARKGYGAGITARVVREVLDADLDTDVETDAAGEPVDSDA